MDMVTATMGKNQRRVAETNYEPFIHSYRS